MIPIRPRSRRRGLAALASAAALAALLPQAAASADPASPAGLDNVSWPDALPDTTTVTLVTGDRITVTTGPDGRTGITAVPAPGTSPVFRTETAPTGDTYVYPDTAAPALSSGRVARDLFNITRLVADGYDDASSSTLPVIVDYSGTPRATTLEQRADDLSAVRGSTALTSIGANALEVSKKDAREFYADVAAGPAAKLSLDGKVEAALDVSVPLVGAPEVWAGGYDGTGVKVAVLDTGIDSDHPDFAGHILGSKSFIDGQAVQDGNGHGTHVASTIMGSGAASDGKFKGVAPGADLLIGKVLNNGGSGSESGIISGMEWAVAQGADVVSMSLGGETQEPADEMSRAVDALTASSGALFVVAAGNSGPSDHTVGTPGIADSALTVGAFDKSDALASFSSRGPRSDGGIKPEITAPGVGIVAARAAGTTIGQPFDDRYTALNGTSMATPHVSGAAALLVQQHPDWKPAQLKDALVSTSEKAPGYSVYQQGAGRLAVDRASAATVFASATADFGTVGADEGSQDRTVTYTNTGAQDVTLALDLTLDRGETAPAGAVSLSASELTVPAGGTASATVTVDPSLGGIGRYNGYLTATADKAALTTAVGYVKAPPQRTVTFHLTGRDGKAAGQVGLQILDVVTDSLLWRTATTIDESEYQVTLPEGRYAVQARITTYNEDRVIEATDYFAEPEIDLDSDRTLELDARTAKPLRPLVTDEDRPLVGGSLSLDMSRARADGRSIGTGDLAILSDRDAAFGVIPSTTTAEHGTFHLAADYQLRDPLMTATRTAGGKTAALPLLTPSTASRFEGTRKLAAVSAGAGEEADYAGLDVTGKLVVVSTTRTSVGALTATAEAHGAAAVLFTRPVPGATLVQSFTAAKVPVAATPYDSGRSLLAALAAGPVTVTLDGRMDSRFTYTLPMDFAGRIPADAVMKTEKDDYARLVNDFHAEGAGRVAYDVIYSWHPWQESYARTAGYHWAPGSRTDLVYAHGVSYQQLVRTSTLTGTFTQDRATGYQAGRTYHRDWLRAPLHPNANLNAPCSFCRSESASLFAVTPFGDSDPGHFGTGSARTTVAFRRDGVEVADYSDLLVPQAATYRVDYNVQRTLNALESLSSSVNTSWTFRSEKPAPGTADSVPGCKAVFAKAEACAVLPVIMTGYDVPLDAANRAPAGRHFTFDVTTHRQAGHTGPKVSGMTVEVSYDDGATWTDADEVRLGRDGSAAVDVTHPAAGATTGYVSLRVAAWDAAGNRTEQTVLRAYALK